MSLRVLAWASLLLCCLWSLPALATQSFYTSRGDWNASVAGSEVTVETFDGFAADTSFSASPLDLGSFEISQFGGGSALASANLIDAPPARGNGPSIDLSAYVLGFANRGVGDDSNDRALRLIFDGPISAFGADWSGADGASGIDLLALTQGGEQVFLPGPSFDDIGFWGFVDDEERFTELYLYARTASLDGTGELFGMDDVSFAAAATSQVPEPGTAALLAFGLAALGATQRRRSRR